MSQPPHQPFRQQHGRPGESPYQAQHGHERYQPQHGQPLYSPPPVPQAPAAAQRPARPATPTSASAPSPGLPFRLPSAGVLLTMAGLVIQVLSLTVLPVGLTAAGSDESVSMPQLWQAAMNDGAQGFSGWYVLLFSYPLVALSIVLALAAVLESVAMKVVWGGLAVIGLGAVVVRYGFGPFAAMAGDAGVDFSAREILTAIVALTVLVVCVFVLRTAVSMFRRVAGLIMLGLAGVHIVAVLDLVQTSNLGELSFGAFGPALGYLFVAAAAFVGPRRLPGM